MALTRAAAVTVALGATALGMAAPASAQDQINGDYTYVNGATTNTWSITTQCNEVQTCGGTVSGSTGMVARLMRLTGGPWTVDRHDVPDAWQCPDGGVGPADQLYSFDPVTLAGTLTLTRKAGVCNDPAPGQIDFPVSLQKVD